MQDQLARGQALAKSGELTARAATTRRVRPQAEAAVRRALDAGRATTRSRRLTDITGRIDDAGATSLDVLLRALYRNGASVETLARATGLGHTTVRRAMDHAGIARRPAGVNTPEGKRSRADRADRRAAALVGTDDIVDWLAARRAASSSIAQLASAVGHSAHWVTTRLQRSPPASAGSTSPI